MCGRTILRCQTDVDIRVLFRAMAADPAARVTTEKLLALVLRESALHALDEALATIRQG